MVLVSRTRAAVAVLAMISLVIVTLLIYRGAQQNTGTIPDPHARAFAGGCPADPHLLGYGVNSVPQATFILSQLAVSLTFLVIVTYSKHLHISVVLNTTFSRRPTCWGRSSRCARPGRR